MKPRYLTGRLALFWCCTALMSLQLTATGATISNRWSFNELSGTSASDSVGGQAGTLMQGAHFDGAGSLVLSNCGSGCSITSIDTNAQYLAFPPNIVANYSALTVETWCRPDYENVAFADWNRLWDFGNSDGNAAVGGYYFFRAGSSLYGIGAAMITTNGNFQGQYPAGLILADGQWSHVACASDPVSGRLKIYTNGVLGATIEGFTNTPALAGPTTNNWLGRSQFAVDRALDADYDEFRIYNGALNPLEVAANYQNGPNSAQTPASYGTVTNITLIAEPTMSVGATRTVQLLAYASGLTNQAIDIHDSAGVTYTSGNTNILTVDAYGVITGVAAGTTNVIAQFASVSSTQSVTVVTVPTTLVHRYSFTSDANDSVGTAHGTFYNISGFASISGGQLNLVGQQFDYVDLPPYMLATSNILNGALTFQGWMTAFPDNAAFTRLFDFGNTLSGNGATYIYFAPNSLTNGGTSRVAVSDTSPGSLSEDGVNAPNILGQTNVHVAVVWNPGPSRRFLGLFINGTLVGQMTTTKPYSSINNVFSYIGRSTWVNDPWLNGSINEFRVYDGELDRIQVAASYQYGPDSTNLAIGNFVSFELGTGGSTLPIDQLRQASCIISFQNATNVNLLGDAGLTLSSTDTNVVTITAAGVMRGISPGTATLTAVFRHATFTSTNFYTNSAAVTTVLPPATLMHRYSFNQSSGLTVTDSVGAAHGVVRAGTNTLGITNAFWGGSGTVLTLNATGIVWDTYVDLPDGIISSLTSNATFETWVAVSNVAWNSTWQRIFDFGSVPGSPGIFLARRYNANNFPRFDWFTGFMDDTTVIFLTGQAHIVVLYDDADNSAVMYLNGTRVAQSAAATLPLSGMNDTNNWLGRSHFSVPFILVETNADPYLRASLNEFRIYSGLLTEAEIRRNQAIGPDQLVTNAPIFFGTNTSAMQLRWPTYAARFNLESSPVLGPAAVWSPVSASLTQLGTNFQVTVPFTGSARYFRLKR